MRSFQNIGINKTAFFKAVIIGTISTACIIAMMMCALVAVLLSASLLPYEYLDYIMLAIDAVAIYIGSYIAARISKSHGMIIGCLTATATLVAITVSGLCASNSTITMITLIRALSMIIIGGIAGIKGVNVKEKIRIK